MKVIIAERTVIERVTVMAETVAQARGILAKGHGIEVARTIVSVEIESVIEKP